MYHFAMKHIMKYQHILLSVTFILLSLKATSAVDNLNPDELIEAQKNGTVIIDIRTPGEWLEGTIPNSSRIMFFDQKRKPLVDGFMAEFKKIVTTKDQAFVLVCRSGSRTAIVTKYLNEKLGYSKAGHLEKGMTQWVIEKHQVEKIYGH